MTNATTLMMVLFIMTLLFVLQSNCKRFSLPNDPAWPNATQIASFISQLDGKVIQSGDAAYKDASATWNLRTGPPQPFLIVLPTTKSDIAATLNFASKHVIRVSVKSTGHHQDIRNTVDDAIMLNMKFFNQRTLDKENMLLTVGPGQSWGEIHHWLRTESQSTIVAASGADPGVGPAGWAMGGGHGRLTRMYGLGVDLLTKVDLVLANGTFITASSTSHIQLFRAIRGSGGHPYGIITALTFNVFPDPGPVSEFQGAFVITDKIATDFQLWLSHAPNFTGAYFITGYSFDRDVAYALIAAYCIGDSISCSGALQPLAEIQGCQVYPCKIIQTYNSYTAYLEGNKNTSDVGGSSAYLVSTALDFKKPGQLTIVSKWMNDFVPSQWPNASIGCSGNGILGGFSTNIDPSRIHTVVAPAMRNALMALTCYVSWDGSNGVPRPELVSKIDEWADSVLKPTGVDQWVYWNEPQHNFESTQSWQESYYGSIDIYNELLQVKSMYDPNYVLVCYHCVGWEKVENVDPATCPDDCSCSNQLSTGVCAHKDM